MADPYDFRKFVFPEFEKRRLFVDAAPRQVAECGLSPVGHTAKQLRQLQVVRTRIGALAAAHARRAHMGQTGEVVKQRFRR